MSSGAKYSIKHLESLTGIKGHTIRIWEKRYGLLQPERTDTNLRKYSDDDLRKLLSVSALAANGYKISAIAKMTEEELHNNVYSARINSASSTGQTESLIAFMLDLNEFGISSVISNFSSAHGFEACLEELLFPFFIRIGVMWQTGSISPAQEHFISGIVRRHIIAATSALPLTEETKPPIILFLPEDELHELSLLYYNFVLRSRGYNTLYLGQAVPHTSLPSLISQSRSEEMLFISTSTKDLEGLRNAFGKIDNFGVKIYGSGSLLRNIDMSSYQNILLFKDKDSLLDLFIKNGKT